MALKDRLEKFLVELDKADSPERFALGCAIVIGELATEAYESASTCEHAWQDRNAGKPYVKIGQALVRAATAVHKLSEAR